MGLKKQYGFEPLDNIRITKRTKEKIKNLAEKYKYKQVTILEYLLNGKININELK